jgi:hypothetical protein
VVGQFSDQGYCGLVTSIRLSSLLKTGAGDDEQITINCQAFSGSAVKSNVSTKDGIPADLLSTAKSETAKRRVSSTSPTKLDEKQKP